MIVFFSNLAIKIKPQSLPAALHFESLVFETKD